MKAWSWMVVATTALSVAAVHTARLGSHAAGALSPSMRKSGLHARFTLEERKD